MHKITARISALPALNFRVLVLVFAFVLAALWPSLVGAATDALGLEEAQKSFASILSYVVKILTFISFLMLDWAGHLFGTELIMGETVEPHLRMIWKLIRNYTNVIFVVLLIYLALANMVASFTGQGNWTIKEKLPRIILALVAINFSFLGMRLAIDAVNVGTTAIFSIADTSLKTFEISTLKDVFEKKVSKEGGGGMAPCTGSSSDCKSFIKHMEDAFCPDGNINSDRCLFKINLSGADPQQASQRNQTARNLTMSFGVFFQQLHKLPLLPAQIQGSWLAILENTLFSSLMAIMYVISLAAVFVAMMARVVVLWLATAFSPALLAMSIMGISAADEMNKQFVTHLIMPLKVAAAFTFSFILLSALSSADLHVTGGSIIQMGPAIGQYFSNEYGFLWQMITVVVFWKSAFWALEGSLAKNIVEGIKSGAEKTGKFVAKAAILDRQVIPNLVGGPENSMTSLSALMGAPRAYTEKYERDNRAAQQEDWKSWGLMDRTGDNQARLKETIKQGMTQGMHLGEQNKVGEWVHSVVVQGGGSGFANNKEDFNSIIDDKLKKNEINEQQATLARKALKELDNGEITQNKMIDFYKGLGLADLADQVARETPEEFAKRYTKEGTGVAGSSGGGDTSPKETSYEINTSTGIRRANGNNVEVDVMHKTNDSLSNSGNNAVKFSYDSQSDTYTSPILDKNVAQQINNDKDEILNKLGLKETHELTVNTDNTVTIKKTEAAPTS